MGPYTYLVANIHYPPGKNDFEGGSEFGRSATPTINLEDRGPEGRAVFLVPKIGAMSSDSEGGAIFCRAEGAWLFL